jgi:pimeloyl-ACP methyl ester carboxylesterase
MPPLIAPCRFISRATLRQKPLFRVPTQYHQTTSQFFLGRYASSTVLPRFKPLGQTLELPSGRTLGYHTSGVSDGIPVIYIHGNPDSGIQIVGNVEVTVAKKLGIRWIGPDRPGIGLSTMSEDQEVKNYSQDVRSLVNHLDLKQCFILGTSGGTGHTLACARDPPPQLRGLGICAGVGPVECGFESMGDLIKQAWDYWRDYPAELTAYIEAEYVHLARIPMILRSAHVSKRI